MKEITSERLLLLSSLQLNLSISINHSKVIMEYLNRLTHSYVLNVALLTNACISLFFLSKMPQRTLTQAALSVG